jgi:hypothetical protein
VSILSNNPAYYKRYEEERLGTPDDTDTWNSQLKWWHVSDIINEIRRLMRTSETILDERDLEYLWKLVKLWE